MERASGRALRPRGSTLLLLFGSLFRPTSTKEASSDTMSPVSRRIKSHGDEKDRVMGVGRRDRETEKEMIDGEAGSTHERVERV